MQGIHQLADIIDSETQSQVSDKIQLIRTTQDEYLAKKKQSTKHAICHVDGEHTFEAVVKLLDALPNLMKQDGLIIIDDILNLGYPGIAEAVYTHPNFKKSFFPIIYAFNKGVFIYGTSEKSRQSLIHTLNNQLKNKSYTIRKLHDQSLMVYHAAPATPSPSSTKKLIMRIISIFQ
jgi:hypothetical protein